MVPTVALPPVMPLTDQATAVLVDPVIVAPKACVAPGASVALVGDTATLMPEFGGSGFVVPLPTLIITVSLVVAPTPVCATFSGTCVPACAALALPVTRSSVAETRVLASGTPPKVTTTPSVKLEPFSRRVNAPGATVLG